MRLICAMQLGRTGHSSRMVSPIKVCHLQLLHPKEESSFHHLLLHPLNLREHTDHLHHRRHHHQQSNLKVPSHLPRHLRRHQLLTNPSLDHHHPLPHLQRTRFLIDLLLHLPFLKHPLSLSNSNNQYSNSTNRPSRHNTNSSCQYQWFL